MKFFTASYFFHTFVTETSASCDHGECDAGIEEGTLLQLQQFKNRGTSHSKKEEEEMDSGIHRSALIDQRIINGLHYMEEHGTENMLNWKACLDKMGGPQMMVDKDTFDEWTACFDAAEKADGMPELSLTALNTSQGNALERQGHNCWNNCNHRGGSCSWCGTEGACCRRGWGSDPAECGNNGGDGYHMCTLRVDPSGSADRTDGQLQNAGADCYERCNRRTGDCHYCGPEGACCRRGWSGTGCASDAGMESYHSCVWREPARVHHRARIPQHCEPGVPSSHECSCEQMRWRQSQYAMWDYYARGWGPQVALVGNGRAQAVGRCGFICPTRASWFPITFVGAGTEWTSTNGRSVSDGWEISSETEREITDTMSANYGFEFEGIGFGTEMSTTLTTRQQFSSTLSGTSATSFESSVTRPWPVPGQVWQAQSTTRDTCGGTVSLRMDTYALTPSSANRPRCFPGRCNEHNTHGFCCTCLGGSQSEIPGVSECIFPPCTRQTTVDYVFVYGDGRPHPVTFNPGVEMEDGTKQTLDCGTASDDFTGSITVECAAGGLAVVAAETDCHYTR